MTRDTHRQSVPDRARRRAIRAYATQLGVSYSVAARLLRSRTANPGGRGTADAPGADGGHGTLLFALRESRRFALRVRDTRLATDLPTGRATHLTERFPPVRGGPVPLYAGAGRHTVLGMLYTVLAVESPDLTPGASELEWVAELGEETAVDTVCATLDRAARLLLDDDAWRLWTRIEAALSAAIADAADRRLRDVAIGLDRELRSVALRGSLAGARQILDAVLVSTNGGHCPGTRVGTAAMVVGVHWSGSGGPTAYDVHTATGPVTLPADAVSPAT